MSKMATTQPVSAGLFSSIKSLSTRHLFVAMGLSVVAICLAEIIVGPVFIPLSDIGSALMGTGDQISSAIVTQIRLPRLFLGIAVGVGLALSGCALQGVLRNPLADPGLVGVTGGASAGAVTAIVLGDQLFENLPNELRPYILPIAAFLGAALVTSFVFKVSRRSGSTSVATLILAGVAINAIAIAIIGIMTYLSDDQQLRDLTFWTMGALGGANWIMVIVTSVVVLFAAQQLRKMGHALDLFQLGERAAFHAGLDVEKAKRRTATLTALAVGTVTAAAGPIGFIGLIAPHMARLIIGPSHRLVLPASALIGTGLILTADLIVRNSIPPAEPPIGLATSLIGGPFFLWLLLTRMKA